MKDNNKFQHPEGKIELLDGRVLDCYLAQDMKREVNNELSLDTTGVYLSLKKPYKANMVKDDRENDEKELEKLFLDNAFLFLENRERILSDSRMFLSPLPFSRSGLMLIGTSGFRNPTLGIFIEFWMACAKACIMEDDGRKWLLYHIAGSPLSGSNRCGLVDPQGEVKQQQLPSLNDVRLPFVAINTRYDEAKSKYDAYTLQQVLTILKNEGAKTPSKDDTHIFFLEQANRELKSNIRALNDHTRHIREKLHRALMELKCEELKAFMADYKERKMALECRLAQIRHKRIELRKQMRSGEIDNIQYQKLWMPLNKEKRNIAFEVDRFVYETLRILFPDDDITLSEVKDFLDKHHESNVTDNGTKF